MLKLLPIMALLFLASCSMMPEKFRPLGVKSKIDNFKVSWAKNMDPEYNSGNLPIALNSPLIHDGLLYAGSGDGVMSGFSLENGRTIWSKKDNGAYHSAPVAYKDQIIYGNKQGRLYSRHGLTGKLKFNIDLGSSIETKGVVYKGRLFVQARNHKIFCLDVESGKVLWAYKRSVPFLTTLQRASRPLVKDNKVYVGFADGYLTAFSLEEGVLLWESRLGDGNKFVDIDSTPVFYKGNLYVGSLVGDLVMVNSSTGAIVRRLNYKVARAPIVFKNNLLVGTNAGELVLLDPYHKELMKKKISKFPISSMNIWKNKIVASTIGKHILLVKPVDFSIEESFSLGTSYSAIFGQTEVKEDVLAALSSRYRLYVFR